MLVAYFFIELMYFVKSTVFKEFPHILAVQFL